MSRIELKAGIDTKDGSAVIEMREGGNPIAHMRLTAAELEGVIHLLAQERAKMAEQVPLELDPGAHIGNMATDPTWLVGDNPELGKWLGLRHPGFGWLSFALPQSEANHTASLLTSKPAAQ